MLIFFKNILTVQLADRPVKSYVCIGPLTILYFYMHCIYFLNPIYYLLR